MGKGDEQVLPSFPKRRSTAIYTPPLQQLVSVARLLNRRAGKLLYAPPRRTPTYYRRLIRGGAESGGFYSLALLQESGHDSHPTYRNAIACWSPRHGFMATMIKIFSSVKSRIVIFHMSALQSVQNLACDQMLSAAMSTGKRTSRRCIFGLSVTLTWWVYQHQEPLIIPSLDSETRFPAVAEMLKNRGVRSVSVLPLTTVHRRLGSLALGSTEADAYTEEEVNFLSFVAQQWRSTWRARSLRRRTGQHCG